MKLSLANISNDKVAYSTINKALFIYIFLMCYLVIKPLLAAGMSADIVRGWGQMWNFKDNLSAKDIICQHTSKPDRGLFILLPSQ